MSDITLHWFQVGGQKIGKKKAHTHCKGKGFNSREKGLLSTECGIVIVGFA